MQSRQQKTGVEEGFTTIGHAVLNNSINFKNRLQKPSYLHRGSVVRTFVIVQVFFIKFRIIIFRE